MADKIANSASPEEAADISFDFIAGINAGRNLMGGKPFVMPQLFHKEEVKKIEAKDVKEENIKLKQEPTSPRP